jgi:subtilisin family serine protease
MRRLFGLVFLSVLVLVASLLGTAVLSGVAYAKLKRNARQGTTLWTRGEVRVQKYVPGQLVVRFRHGVGKAAIQADHALVGAAVLKEFRFVENLQLVRLPAGISIKQAARYYRARPDVLYAEPNYIRHAEQEPLTPNDPRYPEMWDLHNTGQSGGTPGADIHASEAWGLVTGSSTVVVAVIDTGIDYTHEDLAANVWSSSNSYRVALPGRTVTCAAGTHGFNAITMTCDPKDDNGHGTHVSGTIGARGDNGIGVVGINWQVQVMACKFLDAGGGGTTSDLITCLEYLALMKDNGVNLVATNNSYGGAGYSQAEKDATDAHRQRGILFIAAAGNASFNNDVGSFYPANYDLPHMISVAATGSNDALADFSNFGRHTVHLGAPGVEILSTVPGSLFGDPYLSASGTSMASPHVVGVAALLKVQDPTRDWKAIKNLILAGGDSIPSLSNTIAQKRLNAYGAVTCSNSVLQSRLQPSDADAYVWGGDSLTFSVLNIDCAAPNGPVEVSVDGGPETIPLLDDGVGPDLEANDGIYVGQRQWFTSEVGDHTLTFPNNDIVTVHVIPPLASYAYSIGVPFAYRDITGTDLHLRDDDSATIRPPFPIQFGGASFPTLNVNSNGNVTFFGPFIDWANTPLPATDAATLVAPFWDDFYAFGGGSVHWDVTGTVPNRELVIEWRDTFAMVCMWSELPRDYATFQIVFFESSSDILFNYADVILGSYDPLDPFRGCGEEVNGGASATIGVQSMSSLANQFSFSTPSLSNNFSILWQIGQLTPAITQLSPFAVLAGSPGFSLHVIGRSFLPGAVIRWNGRDLPTTFVNAGELAADISARDLAAAATAQITVFNPPPNGGAESAPVAFQIYSSYPVPTLTDIAPNPVPLQVPIGGMESRASIIVTLTGTNFVAGSVANWNGADLATRVLSGAHLQATVPNTVMALGTAQIAVVNPTPGGGTSNVLAVSVVNPFPVISNALRFVGAGAPAFNLNIYGNGFTPTSVVRWNGSDRPTRSGGLGAVAAIPAGDVASPGTAQVTVFNPAPGGGSSDPWRISILEPPANDKFANATVIPTYPFTLTENTAGATVDPLDPAPVQPCLWSPPYVQESVWFSFTPPVGGGTVSVDTRGSNYYHAVTAWSGSPGSFVALGCTVNVSGEYIPAPLSFPVNSPVPLHFMVSTYEMGSTGTLKFNLNVGPGFTLGASPAASTVPHDSPATYTITVTPQFGSFNNPIALSCSVAPAGPICEFSQWVVTPGAAAASVTLTVKTDNISQLEMPGKPAPLFALWMTLPVLGLLAARRLVPGANKAKPDIFLALILTAVLLGMPTACGNGGGGGGGTGGGLQTRTFTITVVGATSMMSRQTTTSLTVTY